jgi:hypothetical protein
LSYVVPPELIYPLIPLLFVFYVFILRFTGKIQSRLTLSWEKRGLPMMPLKILFFVFELSLLMVATLLAIALVLVLNVLFNGYSFFTA